MFSFLRLLIICVYLYVEQKELPIQEYMKTNWSNWPSSINKTQLKIKIKACQSWDSFKFNVYSVSLLMVCELLNNLGNMWVYFVCINLGPIESVLSLLKGVTILVISLPLFFDISYLLLQKVNPSQLITILEDKMKRIGYIDGVVSVK